MKLTMKEYFFVGVVTLVAVLMTSLPYIQGLRLANVDKAYLGVNSRAPADTNVYISMIEDIRQGGVLVTNLFTPEHGAAVLFHPLWVEMGLISRWTTLSPLTVFHLERVIAGMVFVFLLYAILRSQFQTLWDRMGALGVVLFSAGFGITAFMPYLSGTLDPEDYVAKLPLDIWVSESNTFLTLYHSALFIVSQMLVLGILVFTYRGIQKNRSLLVWESLAAGFLTLIHPYDLVTVAFIVALMEWFVLARANAYGQLRRYTFFLMPSLLVALYYYFGVLNEPSIAGWSAQNLTEMPPLRNVALGYGFLLPFALLGAIIAWTRNRAEDRLWVLWALSTLVLVSFSLLPFARRLTNGWHIPLAILAYMGWQTVWQWTKHTRKKSLTLAVTWIVIFVTLLSPASIIVGDMRINRERSSPFFVSQDVLVAADWIKQHTTEDDVLYAQPFLGNVLPAYTGRRMYIGHGHQTIDWEQRLDFVTKTFYRLTSEEQKIFFQSTGIDYVVTTPQEKVWGANLPGPGLEEKFRAGDVTVWKVPPTVTSPDP